MFQLLYNKLSKLIISIPNLYSDFKLYNKKNDK